jgi:hypothetical protein
MRRLLWLTLPCVLLVTACTQGTGTETPPSPPPPADTPVEGGKYPGTEDGVKALLRDLQGDAPADLIRSLRPQSADYTAVFEEDFAAKMVKADESLWSDPPAELGAKPEQTELKLWKASTEDITNWDASVEANFPGGYEDIRTYLKPGLTIYRWKYTTPGAERGLAFDGMVHVNGHWAWFPEPWRALEQGA